MRDRELMSRWPTLVLAVFHAGFLLARIHYAGAFLTLSSTHHVQSVGMFVLPMRAEAGEYVAAYPRSIPPLIALTPLATGTRNFTLSISAGRTACLTTACKTRGTRANGACP